MSHSVLSEADPITGRSRLLRPEEALDAARAEVVRIQRQRLLGTSSICKVPSKAVGGRSLDLVVRYSRVGERVPIDTDTRCQNPALWVP